MWGGEEQEQEVKEADELRKEAVEQEEADEWRKEAEEQEEADEQEEAEEQEAITMVDTRVDEEIIGPRSGTLMKE